MVQGYFAFSSKLRLDFYTKTVIKHKEYMGYIFLGTQLCLPKHHSHKQEAWTKLGLL